MKYMKITLNQSFVQSGILKTNRDAEFPAIRFGWLWIGTWIKTPWGWRHAENLEDTTFIPNDNVKKLLKSYYELTVIPSIVLGCLTSLGWYGINWLQTGFAYVTSGEIAFAFFFFLGVMTAEDIFKAWITALDRVGWPAPTF